MVLIFELIKAGNGFHGVLHLWDMVNKSAKRDACLIEV